MKIKNIWNHHPDGHGLSRALCLPMTKGWKNNHFKPQAVGMYTLPLDKKNTIHQGPMDDISPGDHLYSGSIPSDQKANIAPMDDFPSKLMGDSILHYSKWVRSLHPFDNAACNGTLLSAFQLLFRRVAQFFASVQQSYQIPGSKLSPQKRHVNMGIFGIWWGLFLKLRVGEGSCGLL